MIDALFQAGTDQALDDQIARPRPAKPDEPGFKFGQLVKAPFQGISAGSAEVAAFGAEIAGAFGQVEASTGTVTSRGMFATQTPEERKQAEATRNKIAIGGPDFSNDAGDVLRQAAKDMMPDPNTTHASAQVVAGITRFAGKAIGYAAGAGTAAPFLLGADEALTEADKLRQQGVDLATRTQAGAVAGVTAAAAIALPVAVPGSVAKTVAAVVAGGPGGFIAQNAAERAILANAGYDKLANQYDPLDPVGLTLSTLVPAGFGAVALRGAKVQPTTAPTLKSVVLGLESGGRRYGADGQILQGPPVKGGTAKGEMQVMDATNIDPGFGVRPAADNSPAERARVGSDYLDAMLARYGGREDMAMAAYNAGPGALDKALKKGGNWLDHMPAETQAYVRKGMAKLGGERATATARAAVAADPDVVAAARVRQVVDTVDSYRLTPADDITGLDRHTDAVETAYTQMADGQRVAISDLLRAPETLPPEHPYVNWAQQMDTAVAQLRADLARQQVEAAPAKQAAELPGGSKAEAKGSANAVATGKTSPFQSAFEELAPQLTGKQPGQLVNELKTSGKLSPLANNAIVGLVETGGDPKRIAALVGHADALAKEAPGRPHADVMADAIERMRAGEPPLGEVVEPAVASFRALAAEAESANPDMPLRVTEDGSRVTAAQELEAIRREAAEGTDTTLGSDDAPLLQVAANCFLSSGGI